MSSAFETLDHNVLIHILSAIGITGIALNWFTSYITNRSSSVRINTHASPSRSITHDVHQGSVLGPLLFNIYLLPMFDIFTDYPDNTYADDLQLYLNCTDSPTYSPDRLSSCIKSIHQWLTSNSLKPNPTITEAIFLHLLLRSYTLPEPPHLTRQHITHLLSTRPKPRFHLDTTLSLDSSLGSHIIHMHKSIHYHLHCLRLI